MQYGDWEGRGKGEASIEKGSRMSMRDKDMEQSQIGCAIMTHKQMINQMIIK